MTASGGWKERFYNSYCTTASDKEYAWSAKEYDLFAAVSLRRYKKLGLLPKNKDSRILDIACGAGHFLYFLQNRVGYINAEGIDISPEQIAQARSVGLGNLHLGNFQDYLRSKPEAYDLITAQHFIEHLTKDEVLDFLEAIKGALKPGGRVILTTGNVASLFGAAHICADFTHEGGYTPRSLSQLLRTLGYCEVEMKGLGPVCHDLKSGVRVLLHDLVKRALGFYLSVERGRGHKRRNDDHVLEFELLGTGVRRTEA